VVSQMDNCLSLGLAVAASVSHFWHATQLPGPTQPQRAYVKTLHRIPYFVRRSFRDMFNSFAAIVSRGLALFAFSTGVFFPQ